MSIITTAPKHRATHRKGIMLRPLVDIVPLRTDERSMSRHEALRATGSSYTEPGWSPMTGNERRLRHEARQMGRRPGEYDRRDGGTYVQYRRGSAPVRSEPVFRERRTRTGREVTQSTHLSARELDTWIRTFTGYVGVITPAQRKLARDVISHRESEAAYVQAA